MTKNARCALDGFALSGKIVKPWATHGDLSANDHSFRIADKLGVIQTTRVKSVQAVGGIARSYSPLNFRL